MQMTIARCPQCSNPIHPQTRFCTNCGRNLTQLTPTTPQCNKCGQKLDSRSKFCTNCGTPTTLQAQVAQVAPAKSKAEIITCPNCREKVERGSIFCNSCGWYFIDKEKVSTSQTNRSHGQDNRATCKKCGNDIVPNTSFCKHCGNFLNPRL